MFLLAFELHHNPVKLTVAISILSARKLMFGEIKYAAKDHIAISRAWIYIYIFFPKNVFI